jgi:hypothetical protein
MPMFAEVVFPVGTSGDDPPPPQPAAKNNKIDAALPTSLRITVAIGWLGDRL